MGKWYRPLESMERLKDCLDFYKGKKVFITGHTGFKGSWMCVVLKMFGAEIIGYSLEPPTNPNLFEIANVEDDITNIYGDIRDLEKLKKALNDANPDIVIHMAAQPIVRESYANPVYTYETNVMGTVNICEAIRSNDNVKSFVNVTTDKVYKNNEWCWGYREDDALDGYDPYSNSKSCSELVTSSYKKSFLNSKNVAVTTCRAGNVIGGGDFAKDRIIPDCFRFAKEKQDIIVRNPFSTRPYQHVLEPVIAYLLVAREQFINASFADSYNVGPDDSDCVNTEKLVELFCKAWGKDASWHTECNKDAPHEANFLKLDCSKIKKAINWNPRWHIEDAVKKTVEWYKAYVDDKHIIDIMHQQIMEYINIE